VKLLKHINASLMNQVSHGTLNRIFDHEEAAKGEAMPVVMWGTHGGKTT
jgi:hypothetical protein